MDAKRDLDELGDLVDVIMFLSFSLDAGGDEPSGFGDLFDVVSSDRFRCLGLMPSKQSLHIGIHDVCLSHLICIDSIVLLLSHMPVSLDKSLVRI